VAIIICLAIFHIPYSTKLWWQKTLADLADEPLSANVFSANYFDYYRYGDILRGMFLNSVKLPSIILIATLRSLAWPDPTIFSFVRGKNYPVSIQKREKAVLPRETTQSECREDFLLHGCLINLLQQVDYIRQLCIRGSHDH